MAGVRIRSIIKLAFRTLHSRNLLRSIPWNLLCCRSFSPYSARARWMDNEAWHARTAWSSWACQGQFSARLLCYHSYRAPALHQLCIIIDQQVEVLVYLGLFLLFTHDVSHPREGAAECLHSLGLLHISRSTTEESGPGYRCHLRPVKSGTAFLTGFVLR